jgi:xylan 1,4-beta-xylosidase
LGEKKTFANPVLTGFFPDPSAIRVGEDFYMVNSTFQYFPAIVISHSRDLVHWEIVGHAITRNDYLDLSSLADSHGIWAADISYYDGTFYIFATLRLNNPGEGERPPGMPVTADRPAGPLRRQLVMTSKRAEGPYSKPLFLDVDNIDPSHFVDGDGRHYMVISPGVNLVPLSADCSKVAGDPVLLWAGTGERAPEGPHLFRKDGWYYALLAEGGTGFGHRITCARSRALLGPYEASPYNPVLMQRDGEAPIQRAGHGKLVQTPAGDWWILYLCGRFNEGRFTTLGRETALDPVGWTEDGWFVVNDRKGPSRFQRAPDLPEVPYEEAYFDDFDSPTLAMNWQFLRNPDPASWSLAQRPGHYRIWTGDHDLDSIQAKNTLLRREKHHAYSASLVLDFSPTGEGEQAGLTCYYGIRNHVKLCLTYGNGRRIRLVENRNGRVACLGELIDVPEGPVRLKVRVRGQARDFFASAGGEAWRAVGTVRDASFLSDEGVMEGKHHTGTLVGMYATNGGDGARIAADFDSFDYRFDRERAR